MGKRFSFIHCADLHLGEPFGGLCGGGEASWAKNIQSATFKAFEKIIDTAVERRVDAVLISGDVYNDEHHSLAAQMAFARELYRAAEAGIPVYIVHGNHDPYDAWKASIPLPEMVHIFSADAPECRPIVKNGETVANVVGMSYRKRHVHENLAALFHKDENIFTIGMLHTDVGVSHSTYAPCTVEDLRKTGIDYWALGHVHTRKIVTTGPYVVYPGNTQGLDVTESGPKGCYIVTVGAFGTVDMEFVETDAIRWVDMEVDISAFGQSEELMRDIAKRRARLKEETGRPNMIRVVFTGRGSLHAVVASDEGRDYIQRTLNEKEHFRTLFAYFYRLEDHTYPETDLESRRKFPDVVGHYLQVFDEVNKQDLEKKDALLENILRQTDEAKKFPIILSYIKDDMLQRAFLGAELIGAERLMKESDHENYES